MILGQLQAAHVTRVVEASIRISQDKVQNLTAKDAKQARTLEPMALPSAQRVHSVKTLPWAVMTWVIALMPAPPASQAI